ncbi:MAG: bifunctional diaminohydroxyphosphoribosylaminopyrimidine deaminase/5-amino-6-(5-phosphoribosylamino)uracil reductase RibD [Rhodospirillaceae bacterium]|nr:bifunctional diaminohydroxyphosphoribosylaminopyrimidine deaminase/5-amino-6-(5-phosphoribosylamino)uracil reductase RibD [Rhodospirillaceae bacterium]MBT5239830.1 bifunctional diaminohydroxyphosphoribosylaminopyrimidine deaminase/5-amino-6-(5-phosphoribosylamino)uracil reductase RibD [Rhodospirillaceae bacterium]MBT5567154.1 bifunctional diaminohydroxyphosphoribosylaminopyrimidine deaminase/5-amino-6-(5-phosphoribosylamino)uracil reductase RibD [Rhodospirillaceae bacterium]MBT6089367.1 bifun
MTNALALASRGLGTTVPNPSVGCVIVKDGIIRGRGWTQPGGRPHAETEALARAGDDAKDATAYVTLEPCSHQGQTAPCTEALIAAGVSRVVVATSDPDARVNGSGIAALKAAGIEITTGVLESDAIVLNAGFIKRTRQGVPLFALKSASSMDGRIALASGASQWITGEGARRYGHLLRATHDAILVGSGTVQADNPSLICRLPGFTENTAVQPVRVVLDRRLRIDATAEVVKSASGVPTWIVTSESADPEKVKKLQELGVEILMAEGASDLTFASVTASLLGEKGLNRVLIEGGGQVSASFLKAGLVDRIYGFRAPMVIGGDGRPAIGELDIGQLSDAPRFKRVEMRVLGPDTLDILDLKPTV